MFFVSLSRHMTGSALINCFDLQLLQKSYGKSVFFVCFLLDKTWKGVEYF